VLNVFKVTYNTRSKVDGILITVHQTNENFKHWKSVKVAENEIATKEVRLIDKANPRREKCNSLGFSSSIIYKAYEWDKGSERAQE
jgi:hypothetical protein